jgi:nicotinamidase-related amidase
MYSALRAEVPLEDDVSTQLNEVLKNQVLPASSSSSDAMTNQLIVCGQAMSHCVNHTLRDIIEGADHDTCNKITLMSDCCSAVSGFEDAADSFISDMRESGVMVKTSDETII